MDTQEQEGYNPEFNPTGIEGGLDTNELPWLPLSQAEGMSIKPLRASLETGFFTSIIKLSAGTTLPGLFLFGGCDLLVLSGDLSWQTSDSTASLEAGVWGYMPANTRTGAIRANSDVEILLNSYSALGFLDQSPQALWLSNWFGPSGDGSRREYYPRTQHLGRLHAGARRALLRQRRTTCHCQRSCGKTGATAGGRDGDRH